MSQILRVIDSFDQPPSIAVSSSIPIDLEIQLITEVVAVQPVARQQGYLLAALACAVSSIVFAASYAVS